MRKADSLRKWLEAALPELEKHPDRLALYVEEGSIRARQSATLSYALAYTLKVGFWGFAGDANSVFVPVLAWLAREEPTLLRRSDDTPFTFEAEILDATTTDLLLSLPLTESVVVTPAAGGASISQPVEPSFTDDFGAPPSPFIEGFANLELLVPDGG